MLAALTCGTWNVAAAQTFDGYQSTQSVVVSTGLSSPQQVAVAGNGNVYIADAGNNRILMETPSGGSFTQSTIPSSSLSGPIGVAVDASLNVYIADSGNGRVLKEAWSGSSYTESVVSPNGPYRRPQYLAVDGSGNVYDADTGYGALFKETPSGNGYTETTIPVQYNYTGNAFAVAVDPSGNLYVITSGGDNAPVVLKMVPSGNGYVVSDVVAEFGASGIAVDGNGNVFLSYGSRVIEETPANSLYSQLTVDQNLGLPSGLAADSTGHLYVADDKNNVVMKDTLQNGNFGSVAVGSPSSKLTVIFRNDAIDTANMGTPAVVTQGLAGQDFTDAGTGSCTLNAPNSNYTGGEACTVDVVFTPQHPGARYGAVELTSNTGFVVATAYVWGTGLGPQVSFPPGLPNAILSTGAANFYGMASDGNGNFYIVDATNNRVVKETLSGGAYAQSVVVSGLNNPEGIALDGAGKVYISDTFNHQVLVETPSGSGYSQGVLVQGVPYPEGLAVDANGDVFIIDSTNNQVLKETLTDGLYYSESVAFAGLYLPTGIAVDSNGNVFIAETNSNDPSNIGNGWVLKETPSNGSYTQSVVASGFILGTAVTVDGNGNVYITDNEGNQVYKETPSGNTYTQSTVGSNLTAPWAAVADGTGNVYIINDFGSGQVLEENFAEAAALHFTATTVGQTSSNSPQTATIQNSGNAPLSFPIPGTGSNPSLPPGFTLRASLPTDCPLLLANASAPGSLAAGASCNLAVSYSPQSVSNTSGWMAITDGAVNAPAPARTTQQVALAVAGAPLNPTVTWAPPASITYGAALGSYQLDAVSSVPGSFTYSPVAGTVLGAGSHTLSVTFTPTDTVAYTSVNAGVTLVVTKATPAITWPVPSAISYGTALSSTQLDASTPVAGTFTYSPAAGAVLSAGSQTLSVTFTPTDSVDYATVKASVILVVNQFAPVITWATPAAISYGTALSGTQLDASSTVVGSFTYSPAAGTVLGVGSKTVTATFTPTDTTDYLTVTASITVTVTQATPTINWTTPASIGFGNALSATQLNASSPVAGAFVYSPAAGAVLGAGSQTLNVTFTPTDTIDYKTAAASVTLTVNRATPTITWVTPSAIPHGTALSTAQLNATSLIAGSFVYSPPAGTVLNAGPETLSVTFTPADTVDYSTANATVTLAVVPNIVVNTNADDSGTAANCASGSGTPCSLRDALTAAQSLGGAITFASAVFNASNSSAQNTITLGTAGTMAIPANTTITGATSGSGATLTNLVTVSGNNMYGVFSVAGSAAGAALSNLTITEGLANNEGGAIDNGGSLIVNACTFLSNSVSPNQGIGGGAIESSGQLTVNDSTFANNSAFYGGAIGATGSLTVNNSTFTGNAGGQGGAIYNNASLTMNNSTITGNTGSGGGIFNVGASTGSNNILSGDTGGECVGNGCPGDPSTAYFIVTGTEQQVNGVWDSGGITLAWSDSLGKQYSFTEDYGEFSTPTSISSGFGGGITNEFPGVAGAEGTGAFFVVGIYDDATIGPFSITNPSKSFTVTQVYQTLFSASNHNIVGTAVTLSPLGNYGGPTQTMIPPPSSSAICAGLVSGVASGVTTDQRGLPNTNTSYQGYSSESPCVDVGSVQTNYSLSFTTQPPASVTASVPFTAAVGLDESGSAFTASPVAIPLGLTGNGSVLNASTNTVSGIATYPTLSVTMPGTNDKLNANLAVGGSALITAASNSFNVIAVPTTTAASSQSVPYSANAQGITLTAQVTGSVGIVNAGTVTFEVFQGSTMIGTVATSAVINGSASAIYTLPGGTVVGKYTISAFYNAGGAFSSSSNNTQSLSVTQATPTINWAAPSAITWGTALGAAQLNASSGAAGSFSYSPSAGTVLSVGSHTVTATFAPTDTTDYTSATDTVTVTVDQATPTNTLGSSANPVVVSNSVTFTSTVASSVGTPTGTVSFYDGTTLLGSETLSAGVGTYSTSALALGPHSITAIYSGDANFVTVTSSALTENVTAPAPVFQTWVSGAGSDSNPCSRTAPCLTWAAAQAKTAAGGEIDALDPGDFGLLNITQAVTIDGGGGQVDSTLVSSEALGVTVDVSSDAVVILRNLRLQGNAGTGAMGTTGILDLGGGALHIEHCLIAGMAENGISIEPTNQPAAGSRIFIEDTTVQDSGMSGLYIIGQSTANVHVSVSNSRFTGNGAYGLEAADYSRVTVYKSEASGNTIAGFLANANNGTTVLNMIRSVATNDNEGGVIAGGGAGTSTVRVANMGLYNNVDGFMTLSNGSIVTFGNNNNSGGGAPTGSIPQD